MTPAAIYTAVKDAAIFAALAFLLAYVHRADTNAAKVKDLQGMQQQLEQNAATLAQWQKESTDASAQLSRDLASNAAAISQQRAPVLLRVPSDTGTLPAPAAAAAGCPAAARGADQGARGDPGAVVNVRDQVNAFELRFENAFAECRSVLNQWPRATKETTP